MTARRPMVMGDDGRPQLLQAGDTINANMATYSSRPVTNGESAATLVPGNAAYLSAADTVKKAVGSAKATGVVAGLVDNSSASVASGAATNLITAGTVVLTTVQWDAVAGTSGGLTFGTLYFLDPSTPGKITANPPATAGQVNVQIGVALSATELELAITQPVLL